MDWKWAPPEANFTPDRQLTDDESPHMRRQLDCPLIRDVSRTFKMGLEYLVKNIEWAMREARDGKKDDGFSGPICDSAVR